MRLQDEVLDEVVDRIVREERQDAEAMFGAAFLHVAVEIGLLLLAALVLVVLSF